MFSNVAISIIFISQFLTHLATARSVPYPDAITRSQSEQAQAQRHQFPAKALTATTLQHVAPSSGSCRVSQFPKECRTATQALPFIQSSFTRYNITHPLEQAAIVATTAAESADFKFNVDHFPGVPGKGARNMQEGKYNLEYAKALGLYKGGGPVVAAEKVEAKDEASFGAAAWFLAKVCVEEVREGLRNGGDGGWEKYVEKCLGTDVNDDRRAYWERAKSVLEQG